jgi:hypothetical protein
MSFSFRERAMSELTIAEISKPEEVEDSLQFLLEFYRGCFPRNIIRAILLTQKHPLFHFTLDVSKEDGKTVYLGKLMDKPYAAAFVVKDSDTVSVMMTLHTALAALVLKEVVNRVHALYPDCAIVYSHPKNADNFEKVKDFYLQCGFDDEGIEGDTAMFYFRFDLSPQAEAE